MKTELLNYILNNESVLFKKAPDNLEFALFDSKGFWFDDVSQRKYNLIKDEPHLYIAFDKTQGGFHYIGKSFQKGGRWKRSHAYHLGTLAHHLLDTIRYDDQNHQHWIDAWMEMDSHEIIENNLNTIKLKNEVFIVFIPFKFYANKDISNLSKEEIKRYNSLAESQVIELFLEQNKNLLNVQRNVNAQNKKTQQKPKNKINLTMNLKTAAKTAISHDCTSFHVSQIQNSATVADSIVSLPKGRCLITITNSASGEIVYGKPRTINTLGRSVSSFLKAPDTSSLGGNRPKWLVIQQEMIDHQIKQITLTVCPLMGDNTDSTTKKPIIPNSNQSITRNSQEKPLQLSKNFKVVMACSSGKHDNAHISVNNQTIKFKAVSNPEIFEFLPDDPKPNDNCTWRKWVEDNQNNADAIPALAYNLYSPRNPFNDAYVNLYNAFNNRFYILSAGWGLLKANFRLPNYDITFSAGGAANQRVFQNINPAFIDFNHLTNNHNEGLIGRNEDVVFMGGRSYIQQFISLTENSLNNKLIYYFGMNPPGDVLPLGFSYRNYVHPDATNYTWYYYLAQDYANGLTP